MGKANEEDGREASKELDDCVAGFKWDFKDR